MSALVWQPSGSRTDRKCDAAWRTSETEQRGGDAANASCCSKKWLAAYVQAGGT